jgi:hypothetical protein
LGLGAAVAAVGLQTALHLLNVALLDRSVDLFEIQEGGVVTWLAVSATFAAAAFCLLVSLLDDAERRRASALAVGLAFLSLDDAAVLHERLGFTITDALDVSDSYAQVIWPALYLPLLGVLAVLLVGIVRAVPTAERTMWAGLGLLVAGVALEVAGVRVDRPSFEETSFVVEEGVELAGWILVATALAIRLVAGRARGEHVGAS